MAGIRGCEGAFILSSCSGYRLAWRQKLAGERAKEGVARRPTEPRKYRIRVRTAQALVEQLRQYLTQVCGDAQVFTHFQFCRSEARSVYDLADRFCRPAVHQPCRALLAK